MARYASAYLLFFRAVFHFFLVKASIMSSPSDPVDPRIAEDLRVAQRGCDELLVVSEFATKLARSRATGTPLRIKLGLDPTAPDIHLGHTVVLNRSEERRVGKECRYRWSSEQ